MSISASSGEVKRDYEDALGRWIPRARTLTLLRVDFASSGARNLFGLKRARPGKNGRFRRDESKQTSRYFFVKTRKVKVYRLELSRKVRVSLQTFGRPSGQCSSLENLRVHV